MEIIMKNRLLANSIYRNIVTLFQEPFQNVFKYFYKSLEVLTSTD